MISGDSYENRLQNPKKPFTDCMLSAFDRLDCWIADLFSLLSSQSKIQ